MRLYRIIEAVALSGAFALDAQQLRRRGERVAPAGQTIAGDDRVAVDIDRPIDFKAGEIVGFFTPPAKWLAGKLELLAGEEPWPESDLPTAPAVATVDAARRRATEVVLGCGRVLNMGVPAELMADGRPRTEAVGAVLGTRVSAEERDLAWEVHNALADAAEAEDDSGEGGVEGGATPVALVSETPPDGGQAGQ